jgi:two-component system, NtrC family, sensor kinase
VNSRSHTVLVADDRPANRYSIVHALTRSGFTVVEASNGKEALEFAKQLPSVILLDVKLPDILGYEVCRRIKTNPTTSHIPVVQLSAAFLNNESKVYALESGADAYLTQPVEPNVLVATVKSLVRLHDAESRARLSAGQWQATFDALSEGVALVDFNGKIQRCNRAMTALIGLPYADIETRSIQALVHQRFGLTLLSENMVPVQEIELGGRFFRFNLQPVLVDEVQNGSIFIVSEITEQKRAEAALLANERLAATGRMAHTIAHEINNPLEAITNLLYLLGGAIKTPEIASSYVVSAQEELSRVSRISRQILSFNRESISPIRVNVVEILEDVMALNNRAVVEKKMNLRCEWDRSLLVCGFPAQLRQVFSNLLRNAIEASSSGQEIRLRVSSLRSWGRLDECAVRVTIGDRGIGVPANARKRIFEAFFTTKELKGSGIGLWLSAAIIQEHRGRIQVRSSTKLSNSGTCLSVVLPCNWQPSSRP